MMVAHSLIQTIILMIQILEVVVLVALVFEAKNHGSFFIVVLIFSLLGWAGMFFGLMLSCIVEDFMQANLFLTGISQPMIVLAGTIYLSTSN